MANARSWQERLADPSEPLYTMSVVADLLDVDAQVIRRYETAGIADIGRNDGNQRRFSRNDIASLAYAMGLADEGMSINAVARIVALEREVARLEGLTGGDERTKSPGRRRRRP